MKRRWFLVPLLALALGLSGWALLLIPGPVDLELYDVGDLVYTMADFPRVDISLAQNPDAYCPELLVGMDLAARIRCVLPESGDPSADETVDFMNEMIVVRATPAKQAAARAILWAHRARNRVLVALHSQDPQLKAGFSRLVRRVLFTR